MKQQEWALTLDAKNVLKKSEQQFKLDEKKLEILRTPLGFLREAKSSDCDPFKKFWDYFFNDTNFNCLSKEIKRRIDQLTGNNSQNYDYDGYLLNALKIPGDQQKNYKNKIKKWLADGSVNIDRENAFKVCFALKMNPDEANDFLFKGCQQAGLNIRSAKDAIMFFCLLQNGTKPDNPPYSFADIDRIYKLCQSEIEGSVKEDDVNDRNDTTLRLISEIENLPDNAFETENDFINYIKREADHFTGFSKTAYYYYNSIKLDLIELIINNEILSIRKKEMPGTELGKFGASFNDSKYRILLEKFCNYMSCDSNLADQNEQIDSLKNGLSELANFDENNVNNSNKNTKKDTLFKRVAEAIDALFPDGFSTYYEDVKTECMEDVKKRKSLFDVISKGGFWVYLLPDTFDTEKKNHFGKKIQKNFPQFRTIKFDTDPLSIKDNLTVADVARKQIILMKCFEFIYSSLNKSDDLLSLEMNTDTFYSDQIDNVLNECGFYPLYSRHYFDFLILMTLRLLTAYEPIDALLFIRDAMAVESNANENEAEDEI